jgi:hypothetical protein
MKSVGCFLLTMTAAFLLLISTSSALAQATGNPVVFAAVTPCRVVDTRNPDGPYGGPKFAASQSRSFDLNSSPTCAGIPANVVAYSVNFAVTDTNGPGFLLVYPTGGSQPLVSTINYTTAQTIANAAVVPAGTEGKVTVVAGVSGTHVIIDINGYFAAMDPLFISASGKVGVGTNNPGQKLEVAGNANITGNQTVGGNQTVSGAVAAASFAGSGSGLTNLNAGQISSGMLSASRLPANLGFTDQANTFTANQTINGTVSATTLTGSFVGNGSLLTGLNASQISSGTLSAARLPGAVVLTTQSNTFTGDQTVNGTLSATALSGDGSRLTNLVNPMKIALLRWYEVTQVGDFAVGTSPTGVAFDGANIWVANNVSNNVTKLRASDGANLGTFAVGPQPAGLAFDGANIWVTSRTTDTVSKLRASDGTDLGTFVVGSGPIGVAFDGANIWVANSGSNNVSKLRASDGANMGIFAVGSGPTGVAFDGANIWVANNVSNNVSKLRASDGTNLGTFAVGSGPRGVAFDGASIWVANRDSNNVTKLRTNDGVNLGTFAVGSGPIGIAFDGANIWVTNNLSNSVTKLRASDDFNLGNFTVGARPIGVAFDGANIWVTNTLSDTVSKR